MAGLKAVLFDNDGTLVDSHDLILASFRYAGPAVLGRQLSDEGLCFKKCVLRDYSLPVSRGHMELLPDDPRSGLVRSAVLSLRFARHCGEQPVHIVVCWHDA